MIEYRIIHVFRSCERGVKLRTGLYLTQVDMFENRFSRELCSYG